MPRLTGMPVRHPSVCRSLNRSGSDSRSSFTPAAAVDVARRQALPFGRTADAITHLEVPAHSPADGSAYPGAVTLRVILPTSYLGVQDASGRGEPTRPSVHTRRSRDRDACGCLPKLRSSSPPSDTSRCTPGSSVPTAPLPQAGSMRYRCSPYNASAPSSSGQRDITRHRKRPLPTAPRQPSREGRRGCRSGRRSVIVIGRCLRRDRGHGRPRRRAGTRPRSRPAPGRRVRRTPRPCADTGRGCRA